MAAPVPAEEVIRTEIYTHARSPMDGSKLTAAEYALLQEELRTSPTDPEANVSDNVRHIIQLLRLRQLLRRVVPF